MKKFYFTLFGISLSLFAIAQYDHYNIELVGHWTDSTLLPENGLGGKHSSLWAWVNPKTNVEYAFESTHNGTNIIDLSDPAHPKRVAFVKGRRDKCIWREYKTYKNYLYTISDDWAPNSFQIIDLSYLPDSVHVVYDGNDLFERAHTLFIDGDKLYAGGVTLNASHPNGAYAMAVFSLANPEKPVLLRKLNDDSNIHYVHDMFVRNDTVYGSCGTNGLFIWYYDKVANKFKELNFLASYPNQGYNHSSSLTTDGKTLVFCDENKNSSVKVIDVSDIENLSIASMFKSNEGPVPHNPYVKGNTHAVIANHQDGLQIFDIRNPKQPFKTGYFDTDTLQGKNTNYDGDGIHGCWGAYIDLPSGFILASDIQNGLYVLDASTALGIKEHKTSTTFTVTAYPNPATNQLSLKFNLTKPEFITFEIFDITGKKLSGIVLQEPAGAIRETISISNLSAGVYSLKISGKEIYSTAIFVKE